jgi:hypothetical protein
MYEESAISIFRKLPETKTQVQNYVSLIRKSVLDGEVDPLLFLQQVTALELLSTTLKKDELIKDTILEAAEKYGTKSFKNGYASFQIKEVGTTYDYSVCQDVEWEQLKSEHTRIGDRLKARETFLKAIPADGEVFGSDGVQLELPIKKSSTQVVIILDK